MALPPLNLSKYYQPNAATQAMSPSTYKPNNFFGSLSAMFSPRTQQLPNNGGSYVSPTVNTSSGDQKYKYIAPGYTSQPLPPRVDTRTTTPPPQQPTGPQPNAPVTGGVDVNAQVEAIRNAVRAGSAGDIPNYTQFAYSNPTMEDALKTGNQLANTRNDIAVGETDPYGWGDTGEVPFTFAELQAIRKAQAGIYDPALEDAKAKYDSASQDRKTQLDQQFELTKMEKQFGYDMALKREDNKAKAAAAGGEISPYQAERSARTVASVDELLGDVSRWNTGFGSLLSFIPESSARNFKAQLDTLKASIAFGELTAMREASKTGGALGNVSNVELGLLESALGALDRAQSPQDFRDQLEKIKGSITRWQTAASGTNPSATTTSPSTTQAIPKGTDGSSYGFPGYISDGKQWVLK